MRRITSLILIATVLAVLGGTLVSVTGRGEAAEGDPGDYCSQAPDRPLGWFFGDACRNHDECIEVLGTEIDVPGRATCDDRFLHELLDAHHVVSGRTCDEQLVCRVLAVTYYRVVRFVTEHFSPPDGA